MECLVQKCVVLFDRIKKLLECLVCEESCKELAQHLNYKTKRWRSELCQVVSICRRRRASYEYRSPIATYLVAWEAKHVANNSSWEATIY